MVFIEWYRWGGKMGSRFVNINDENFLEKIRNFVENELKINVFSINKIYSRYSDVIGVQFSILDNRLRKITRRVLADKDENIDLSKVEAKVKELGELKKKFEEISKAEYERIKRREGIIRRIEEKLGIKYISNFQIGYPHRYTDKLFLKIEGLDEEQVIEIVTWVKKKWSVE